MSHFNSPNVIYSVGEIKKLVEKAKAGDQDAFTTLYNAFFTPLYRYVFSRLQDKDKTEDIVQTVFVRWYTSFDSYTVFTSPLQYLFVIAKRIMIDEGKKREVLPLDETFVESIIDEESSAVEDVVDARITKEMVLEHFKYLSETQEEVLRLHFFAELTTKEIASILEKEESTIRQIKHRALKTLQQHLHHLYENH